MLAKELLELCESIEKRVSSVKDLAVGDNVEFVSGHNLEGIPGLVQDLSKDGSVTVRVGKSVRIGVKPSDLIKISNTALGK